MNETIEVFLWPDKIIETAFSVLDEFRIKNEKAKSILNDVQKSVSGWQTTARFLGIPKQEISSMESAFQVK